MQNRQILVIDENEETVHHLTQKLLPELGYRTLAAFDAQSGLDLLRSRAPDAAIVALELPDMSGLELLQLAQREALDIPVILMAAYGSEKNVTDGFRLGAMDYLIKPFTEEDVVAALERSLAARESHEATVDAAESPARAVRSLTGDSPDDGLRRQLRQIRVLFGIGKAVTSLLSVEQILERVLDAATFLTEAEESVVWLPESKSGTLRAYARKSGSDDKRILSLSMRDSQVAHVMRTGRPQRLNSGGGRVKVQTGYLARALMSVPLSVRGKVIGVLSVVNRLTPRSFTERDEYLLTSLGDYAAIALHNARIYQANDRTLAVRADELRTLIEITRQFTSTLDLNDIVQRTLRQVHDSWQVESSALWLLDGEKQVLRLMDAIVASGNVPGPLARPLQHGILGYVAQSGQTVSANDVSKHPFYEAEIDQLPGLAVHTLLCVPLLFREQVIGVLQLFNKAGGSFEDADVQRAQSLGAAVAIALRNALDYEWLTAQRETLENRLQEIRAAALRLKQSAPLDEEAEALLSGIIRESTQLSDLATGMLNMPEQSSG